MAIRVHRFDQPVGQRHRRQRIGRGESDRGLHLHRNRLSRAGISGNVSDHAGIGRQSGPVHPRVRGVLCRDPGDNSRGGRQEHRPRPVERQGGSLRATGRRYVRPGGVQDVHVEPGHGRLVPGFHGGLPTGELEHQSGHTGDGDIAQTRLRRRATGLGGVGGGRHGGVRRGQRPACRRVARVGCPLQRQLVSRGWRTAALLQPHGHKRHPRRAAGL